MINNFVIDRIVRGIAIAQGDSQDGLIKEGDVLFSINQIQNASLTVSSESTDAVDALGTPIATFYRAKNAEFSAENALFDMALMATQSGTVKQVADSTNVIIVPCFETVSVASGDSAKTLAHTPKAAPSTIYELKGDGSTGEKFTKSTSSSASASTFVIDINSASLTPPTGFVGDLLVVYEYEADGQNSNDATSITNTATNFPVGCKFIMEVLGCDVCNQTDLIYAYVIFPNAKLSPDFDWSIATDSTHPFSLKAMQDYCSKDKALFSIVIPE